MHSQVLNDAPQASLTDTATPLFYRDYARYALEKSRRHDIPLSMAFEETALPGGGIFFGKQLRRRISFTPYVYNRCTADCRFCSEQLARTDLPVQKIFHASGYEARLARILGDLKEIEIFLSISGMEPLESMPFLARVLQLFEAHENGGGRIAERVVYSNLSAVVRNPGKLADVLARRRITRVETSRHHQDETRNQEIMRFKGRQLVQSNGGYVTAIRALASRLHVRLACVLQKYGVDSVQSMADYLAWAAEAGVDDVTFRELSILGPHIAENIISDYIRSHRVCIFSIMESLPSSFKLYSITQGYYYFSFHYKYENKLNVSFEVGDYEEMIRHHESGVIDKLVYYPTGDLCRDWNMANKLEIR
jgi:MoaA/NifB/PqqE/SkfB family radical SAM enzyme